MARLTRPANVPQAGGFWPKLQVGPGPAVCRSESARPAGFVMLLTRRACYGLLAVQHLAEHVGEGSFAANGLANSMDCPVKHWPRSSSDLPQLGCCCPTTGLRADIHSPDPRYISVFDVIKASEEPQRSGIHGEQRRHPDSVPGYHARCKVSQIVEDMLRELTIEDIEKPPVPPASREMLHRCERRSLTTKRSVGVCPYAAEDSLDARTAGSVCWLHPIRL